MSDKTSLESIETREQWGSRLGFILASIGGAVGLGSVWKFPYVVGENGGGIFILIFLISLTLVAVPILMIEYALGRNTNTGYTGALRKLLPGKKWYLLGILGVIVMTTVLSFYFGIAGWTIAYFFKSITGSYSGSSPDVVAESFNTFLNSPLQLIGWQFLMIAITVVVIFRGVKDGIEKVCSILLPVLFVMIIVLGVIACNLEGAEEGIKFFLVPDFSKLNTETIIAAIGQSFFTLGVGCGNMTIYGSYLDRKKTITGSTLIVGFGGTIVAILMGFIVFPAVFAYGLEPTLGPPLVFMTLPTIFAQMKFGMVFATAFFLVLFFACLTTTICLLEAVVGFFVDEFKWERKKSILFMATVIFFIGIAQMLSFGPWAEFKILGKTIFELSDYIVTNILLPFGGLAMVLLAGWVIKPETIVKEINAGEGIKIGTGFIVLIKYIIPVVMFIVFLQLIGVIKI